MCLTFSRWLHSHSLLTASHTLPLSQLLQALYELCPLTAFEPLIAPPPPPHHTASVAGESRLISRVSSMGNVVLLSSILDAYCKCGEIGDARKVFNEMSIRDAFMWSTLVSRFAKLGDMGSAKELFDMMPDKNVVAWTSVIS
ncbi:hypothetical protein Droror1_Dr00020276 [Drosera rotundifolia]